MAKTNQEKLDDMWWILCSDSGRDFLAELVGGRAASKTLNTPINRGGDIGGSTSLAAVTSWHDAHITAIIDSVSKATGADVSVIKQAVTDGLKAGIKVDVTVNGGK